MSAPSKPALTGWLPGRDGALWCRSLMNNPQSIVVDVWNNGMWNVFTGDGLLLASGLAHTSDEAKVVVDDKAKTWYIVPASVREDGYPGIPSSVLLSAMRAFSPKASCGCPKIPREDVIQGAAATSARARVLGHGDGQSLYIQPLEPFEIVAGDELIITRASPESVR